MSADRKFLFKIPLAKDFDTVFASIGQSRFFHQFFIDAGTLLKLIQARQIHHGILRFEIGVIESAFGHAANQRHLAAFKTGANRTAGTRALAFATASARFTMTACAALPESLPSVQRTLPGL